MSDSSPALVRCRNKFFVFQALRAPNPCWIGHNIPPSLGGTAGRYGLRYTVSKDILRILIRKFRRKPKHRAPICNDYLFFRSLY